MWTILICLIIIILHFWAKYKYKEDRQKDEEVPKGTILDIVDDSPALIKGGADEAVVEDIPEDILDYNMDDIITYKEDNGIVYGCLNLTGIIIHWIAKDYTTVEEQGNNIQLDGSNILSSPAIVGLGRIKPTDIDASGSQWVYFDLPIEYAVSVDSKDVKNKLYSTAIVFTSSIRGGEFIGAPGSTIWIDNVKLESEY